MEKEKKYTLGDFTTFAQGNGVPCNGDLFEGYYKGDLYQAEYYIDGNFGNPEVCLACDSKIEKYVNGKWEEVFFEETIEGDREFNTLLSAIMPKLK